MPDTCSKIGFVITQTQMKRASDVRKPSPHLEANPDTHMDKTIKTRKLTARNDDEEKKAIRKEVEKQRRLQMSSLVASLRSLIPLKLIKGKRSMSDLINETVTHINELKANIEELNAKKAESGMPTKCVGGSSNSKAFISRVRVRHYFNGIEIIATIRSSERDAFLLSKVLQFLIEEGLDVINCVSTVKDDGFCVGTIQCQPTELAGKDLEELQQKLNDIILSKR